MDKHHQRHSSSLPMLSLCFHKGHFLFSNGRTRYPKFSEKMYIGASFQVPTFNLHQYLTGNRCHLTVGETYFVQYDAAPRKAEKCHVTPVSDSVHAHTTWVKSEEEFVGSWSHFVEHLKKCWFLKTTPRGKLVGNLLNGAKEIQP